MEQNNVFQAEQPAVQMHEGEKKPMHVPALVLSIVALVFSLLSPLVSYICGITGLVFSIKKRKLCRTKISLIICIAALLIAVIIHVISTIQMMEVIAQMGL